MRRLPPQADVTNFLRRQHPGVLARHTGFIGDQQFSLLLGNTCQTTRHGDIAVVICDQKGAQNRVPRLDPAIDQGRRCRETDHLLSGVKMRLVQNACTQSSLFVYSQLGTEDRTGTFCPVDLLDNQLVEILQNKVTLALLATPPGCHSGEFEILTEKMPGNARQERHQARVLQNAAADRIRDRNMAQPCRLQQPRDSESRVLA